MANIRIPSYERQVEVPQQRASQAQAPAPLRQAYGEDVAQATGQFGKAVADLGKSMINIEKNKMLVLENKLNSLFKIDLATAKQASSLEEYNEKQKSSIENMKSVAQEYLGNAYNVWEQKVGKELFTQANINYDINKIPFVKEQQQRSFKDLANQYSSVWSQSNPEEKIQMAVAFETDIKDSNLSPLEQRKEIQNFATLCINNSIANASPTDYLNISKEIANSDLDEDKKYLLQKRLVSHISSSTNNSNPDIFRSLEQRINNGTIDDGDIQSLYNKGDLTRTERNALLKQYNSPFNQAKKEGETEIKKFLATNPFSDKYESQSAKQQMALDTYNSRLLARQDDIKKGKIRPIQIAQQIVYDLNSDYINVKQSGLPIPDLMKRIGRSRQDMIAYTSADLKEAIKSLSLRRGEMEEGDFRENLSDLTMWYEMALFKESNQVNIKTEGNQ